MVSFGSGKTCLMSWMVVSFGMSVVGQKRILHLKKLAAFMFFIAARLQFTSAKQRVWRCGFGSTHKTGYHTHGIM